MNKENWWVRIRHYKLHSPQFFTDRRELDFFAGCRIKAWIETELLVLLLRSTKKHGSSQFTHSWTSDWQLFVVVNELLCINYLYIKVQWQQLQLEHFCGDSQVASRNSFFCPRLVLIEEQRTKMKEKKKERFVLVAPEASLIGQMTSNTFGDSSVSAFDFFGVSRPHRWSETLRVFAFPCFMFIFTEHPTNLELCGGKSESVPHSQNMTDWGVLPLSVLNKKTSRISFWGKVHNDHPCWA